MEEAIEQIQYITYKGNKYPVRLGYRAIKGIKEEFKNISITDIHSMDPVIIEGFLWHGLVSGHKFEEKELLLKKEQMEDVLDECFYAFLKIIPLFFPNAKMGSLPEEKGPKGL